MKIWALRPAVIVATWILLAWLGPPLSAQAPDQHLVNDPAQRLYVESPWAHGYVHGYAMGFHCGDLDVQLSHPAQEIKKIRQYKDAKEHFRKPYGDKKSFISGYEDGFVVGYADAYKGSEFRAVLNLRELAQEMPQVVPSGSPVLDTAIERGYRDGRKSGLQDGRADADYRPDGSDCDLALRFKAAPTPYYCSVYSLGYRLGYSDGFHNQRPQGAERQLVGEK